MTLYFLQYGYTIGAGVWDVERYFIDDRVHPGCEVIETVDALSWKDAKKRLHRSLIEASVAVARPSAGLP